jgi:hypothetical protein
MLLHGKKPHIFGPGITVLSTKGSCFDNSMSDSYRGIISSSKVSKLSEISLLDSYGEILYSLDMLMDF